MVYLLAKKLQTCTPNLLLLHNLFFWQMHDTRATMIGLMPTADMTSQSWCSCPLRLEMSTESFYKHYSRQPLRVIRCRHSMSHLWATPATPPPDERLHLNGHSEIIVNSACCVMNATLRRLFSKSQKWNSSEMWWFRGCNPTATYERERETERIPCEEPGALCHQANWEATISKVLMLLWWSVALHGGKTALYSSQQGGSTPCLLSEELGFILRQRALTG